MNYLWNQRVKNTTLYRVLDFVVSLLVSAFFSAMILVIALNLVSSGEISLMAAIITYGIATLMVLVMTMLD